MLRLRIVATSYDRSTSEDPQILLSLSDYVVYSTQKTCCDEISLKSHIDFQANLVTWLHPLEKTLTTWYCSNHLTKQRVIDFGNKTTQCVKTGSVVCIFQTQKIKHFNIISHLNEVLSPRWARWRIFMWLRESHSNLYKGEHASNDSTRLHSHNQIPMPVYPTEIKHILRTFVFLGCS